LESSRRLVVISNPSITFANGGLHNEELRHARLALSDIGPLFLRGQVYWRFSACPLFAIFRFRWLVRSDRRRCLHYHRIVDPIAPAVPVYRVCDLRSFDYRGFHWLVCRYRFRDLKVTPLTVRYRVFRPDPLQADLRFVEVSLMNIEGQSEPTCSNECTGADQATSLQHVVSDGT
jgi:hypothetical protein